MPHVTFALPLVYLFLRCDTLNALARDFSGPLPYAYALIYAASVRALREAHALDLAAARTHARRAVASLGMTGRFALGLRERGGPDAPARVPCDGCGLRAASTTRGALLAGDPALCERCASPEPDPDGAGAGDPRFDIVDLGDVGVRVPAHACDDACELCPAARAELDALADEHRAAAVEHQERAFEVWPVAPPTLPWQLDHEPSAAALCAGVA